MYVNKNFRFFCVAWKMHKHTLKWRQAVENDFKKPNTSKIQVTYLRLYHYLQLLHYYSWRNNVFLVIASKNLNIDEKIHGSK